MKRLRKLRAGIASAAVAMTTLAAGVLPAAHAAEGNVVYLGDSYSANPNQIINDLRGVIPPEFTKDYPQREGCFQAPDNAPRQLAGMTGLRVDDWSCTAQTSRTQLERVRRAIAVGDINPGTRTVVLAAGMNNYGPFGLLDRVNIFDPRVVVDTYVADLHTTANEIRAVAPNVKLVIPGQLSFSTDDSVVCWINVVPGVPGGAWVPLAKMYETSNRNMQMRAAREIGAEFVDIMNTSRYHDTCAPEERRFVAGVIDTTTPNYNMAVHPSRKESEHVAQQLAPIV